MKNLVKILMAIAIFSLTACSPAMRMTNGADKDIFLSSDHTFYKDGDTGVILADKKGGLKMETGSKWEKISPKDLDPNGYSEAKQIFSADKTLEATIFYNTPDDGEISCISFQHEDTFSINCQKGGGGSGEGGGGSGEGGGGSGGGGGGDGGSM